ncbi:hypothetical protein TH53_19550 [Pedobacter lusitanus]|uniref:Lipoprotein n=1 Tax=Pedobacter lusitanus TaxID=1503925 RepID=A0A0D0F255_9SPHI|nr:hypothetical protein [Pedobacter lusitanus]KIO75678.1 hypothetical protein TH53_19550 [Pedobacter lusitanus]
MKNLSKICSVLLLTAVISSCSTPKKTASNSKLLGFKYNYCAPGVPYLQNEISWKDSVRTDLSKTNISAHDQLLCRILGISSYVNDLYTINHDHSPEAISRQVLLKQKITSRLLLAQTQLQAVAAELDCEGERADMAAAYLDGINSKRNTKLTVGSVIIGALTTVATAAISKNSVQTAVGVGGGLLGAGLGALTINPKGKQLEFYHDHNLLRTIWTEPKTNTDYPEFVWEMLHEKSFSNKGDVTLSQSIKNRWLQFEFDEHIDQTQEALLFGNGGYYRSDDLHTRATMINQLQSTIRSLNQDLSSLIAFITRME